MRAAFCLLVVLLTGCGGSSAKHLAVSADGRAVLQYALDNGRLNRDWSCGSLRAALTRLRVDIDYSTVVGMLHEAAGRTCDQALTQVRERLRARRVRAILGVADRTPRLALLMACVCGVVHRRST